MNIETKTNLNIGTNNESVQSRNVKNDSSDFSKEMQEIKDKNVKKTEEEPKNSIDEDIDQEVNEDSVNNENVDNAIDDIKEVVEKINQLNRSEEKSEKILKESLLNDDKNRNEDFGLIDNNMNIQEPKDKINLQMGNMNFNSDGQPFTEFVNPNDAKKELQSNAKDLAEEKAILSTMEENIAIANKNMALTKTKTVSNEQGIKKVDKNTNVTVDTIVSYDTVIMEKSDVDFFAKLVNDGKVDLQDVQNASKSTAVSKTLADLIAKAMNDNKPIRINFDNDISVIIKIGRDGKISADFLPSSQIAEAYLRENLPLLKQRFDDNNIDYGELNQRKQKQDNNEDRKKGRKDE